VTWNDRADSVKDSVTDRPTALFAMRAEHLHLLFPPHLMERLAELAAIDPDLVAESFDDPNVAEVLPKVEILITGWGCPPLDAAVLRLTPRLRAVLHAAGSVKAHITREAWDRELVISSARHANAIPVAEYTLAAILLAGKGIFGMRERYRARRAFTLTEIMPGVGNYGCRVGIVGASRIGRQVLGLLAPFDLELRYSDPYSEAPGIRRLELDELVATSEIVSLHAPESAETRHLLDRRRLGLMRDGAVLINTARGGLVDTEALINELASGRLSAVLDVTEPEPLPADSPLFTLPNVFLTPHVAGSHGNELSRMGASVVGELKRLTRGSELLYAIRPAELETMA
jgi:phosphoglycerate dehydrogenase-like enzyme